MANSTIEQVQQNILNRIDHLVGGDSRISAHGGSTASEARNWIAVWQILDERVDPHAR